MRTQDVIGVKVKGLSSYTPHDRASAALHRAPVARRQKLKQITIPDAIMHHLQVTSELTVIMLS